MSVITEEQRTQFREEGYFILERVLFLAASQCTTEINRARSYLEKCLAKV